MTCATCRGCSHSAPTWCVRSQVISDSHWAFSVKSFANYIPNGVTRFPLSPHPPRGSTNSCEPLGSFLLTYNTTYDKFMCLGSPHSIREHDTDRAFAIFPRDTPLETAYISVRIETITHAGSQRSFSQHTAIEQTGLEVRRDAHNDECTGAAHIDGHSWQPCRLPGPEAARTSLPSASAMRWRSAPLENACTREAL